MKNKKKTERPRMGENFLIFFNFRTNSFSLSTKQQNENSVGGAYAQMFKIVGLLTVLTIFRQNCNNSDLVLIRINIFYIEEITFGISINLL